MLRAVLKGVRTVADRLNDQGVRTTALWAYARGIPKVTGVPLLEYSRITDSIYVGPQHRRNGKRALMQAGITHTVNMRSEFDDAAHGLTLGDSRTDDYCYLPTIDDEPILDAHLVKGIDFIAGAVKNGGKVYIHCTAGVGRAPSMAAAYFINEGYTLGEALTLIRASRPFIRLTPKQIQSLERFENKARRELTVAADTTRRAAAPR